MKAKIIIIESCIECPHIDIDDHYKTFCMATKTNILTSDFPKNCPLDEMASDLVKENEDLKRQLERYQIVVKAISDERDKYYNLFIGKIK